MTITTEVDPAIRELIAQANDTANNYFRQIQSGNAAGAAEIAIAALQNVIAESVLASPTQRKEIHYLRILFHGLRDFANMVLCIGHDEWVKIPNAVELAWDYAHDARDRLDNLNLDDEYAEYLTEGIDYVMKSVNEQYGDGLYSSWEMKFSAIVCSICEKDVRGCDHIGGHWYDNKQCRYEPQGGELVASAFVHKPRDPRCRVWPWQLNKAEGKFSRVALFKLFEHAGFGEDVGEVVDTETIFPMVKNVIQHPREKTRYEVYAYRKLKRQELIDTIRKCKAQHRLDTVGVARVRFYTLIGSNHRREDDSEGIVI